VTVHPDHLEGPGIGDNSVGLAAVASLPIVLEKLGVELDDNLILLGSTRSLGHGDLGGLRFFLEHNNLPIRAAVVVEGVYLGRLSYASLGMLRGEITCRVPKGYDWTRFNAAGAISALSRVINALQEIPMAKEPPADLILGSVGGGTAFNTIARKASLRFEVRAEVAGVITSVLEQIEEIVEEVAQRHAIDVNLQVVARRKSGGLAYRHPLVRAARRIMKTLEVEPRIAPSVGELAALINADIPSLTLGLTESENYHDYNEAIRIEPLYTGLTQLIGVLRAVDMGAGEEAPPKKKTAKKKSAEASTS
jgi:acetylornithine deacetylase/succinyl-diaminopimelate desuccinylase-like protein